MKFLLPIVLFFLYFIKNNVEMKENINSYLCDFYFNPSTSVKPVLGGKHDEPEEVACLVNNPILGEIIFLVCPKRKDDYSDIELVPSSCFSSHLYSPYTSGKNEKNIEKLDIDDTYTHVFSYDDYEIRTFRLPNHYKYDKIIYCRCDNRKTEKEHDDKQKYQGKTGLVKIILNSGIKKPKVIDLTSDKPKNDDITIDKNNITLNVVESEIIELKINDEARIIDSNDCASIINTRYNVLSSPFALRTPTVFLREINCEITIEKKVGSIHKITIKGNKTKNIEGCDFTKPKGEGIFKHGFVLSNISEEEKICTVYIGSSKKNIVAGLKCPYKLTPTFCFSHVLYEKKINNDKVFKTFLLRDILETNDIEYYTNGKGSLMVGLPTKSYKYATVRCICENKGKRGIMELKIASSYISFINFILLLITFILLYLF
ncbi:6-cysteine protein, putative [Plasmodium relictum]|uniref:6-cysteine protein, putative n=1 Tax=Plasmodium relictum TaxID=85471 RepID=A0A1J1H9Y5_PLARL|nr:6-cysteine protein, putative [Plasmodium relictum]CRH01624.1 6-cysteine protein, putative [Plasmodium relictum]